MKKTVKKASVKSPAVKIAGAYHGDNSTRYTYRPKASDEQKELAISKTVDIEPKGYLMLKQVILEANKMSIPTSRVMKALGGNRGVGDPLNANWVFVYYKRSRWLPKACLKDLNKLAAMKRTAGRPQAEKAPKPKVSKQVEKASKTGGTPKGFVRDAKGKMVPKVADKDLPGAKAVLKPKVFKGGVQLNDTSPVTKGKMSTTRTGAQPKGKTVKIKHSISEAGLPVLGLIEE